MSIREPPNYLPTEFTEPTEVSGARYSPTDCTDIHRLGGYGILPYPRSHQTIFPQKPTQPNHLCASVKSVGGYSPPETSVNSVNSVGGLAQTNLEWVLWKEFGGLRGYGIPAIPTQPQNYLPTEFTEHTETTGGEEKSVYICAICGRLLSARRFCGFCVFRGRFLSEAMLVQRRPLHPLKIATPQQQGCHATTTILPRYNNKVATLRQNAERRM